MQKIKAGISPAEIRERDERISKVMRMLQDAEGSQLDLCKRARISPATWNRRLAEPGTLTLDELSRIHILCQAHRLFFDPLGIAGDIPYREVKRMMEVG